MSTLVESKINEIVSVLKHNPDVLGLVLFGSRSNNTHKASSDVDLLIVLNEYNSNLEVLHPTIEETGIRFDVWLVIKDKLDKWCELKSINSVRVNPFINNAILTGVIIKDTDLVLAKAKEAIINNSKKSMININLIRFKLTHGVESLEHQIDNLFLFDLMYYQEIAQCIYLYGVLNKLTQKSMKDILKQIECFNKPLYELLESSNKKESIKDKLHHLKCVQAEVLSLVGGHVGENEFIATGDSVESPYMQTEVGKDLWIKLTKQKGLVPC